LSSIFENVKGISFEVIVVDNNSSDGSAEMVKNEFPLTNLVASDVNHYYAKGNNIGYKISKGNYIGFLNPDTIIYPNTFRAAVEYLRTHPDVGAVSCKFLNPDGSFQREYYRPFPKLSTVLFCLTSIGHLFDKNILKSKYENIYSYKDKSFNKVEKIDQPGATFIVIPRFILLKVGVFDERFPIFFNDVDLFKRIWEAGYEIHVLNDITITHYAGKGVQQIGELAIHREFDVDCYRYFKKHHGIAQSVFIAVCLLTNFLFPVIIVFTYKSIFRYFKRQFKSIFQYGLVIFMEYFASVKEFGITRTNMRAARFIIRNVKLRRRKVIQ
jgi:GT2 family glycosyltransferase